MYLSWRRRARRRQPSEVESQKQRVAEWPESGTDCEVFMSGISDNICWNWSQVAVFL